MSTDTRQLESEIQQLLEFLDSGADSIDRMLDMLSQLRAALIRRDEPALRQMQDTLPQVAAERLEMESQLRAICRKFASLLTCPAEQINLTKIASLAPAHQHAQICEKQQSLQTRVNRLAVEHRSTEMLLRECERLNRLLLAGMMGSASQTVTYTPSGLSRRELHRSIVSMRM